MFRENKRLLCPPVRPTKDQSCSGPVLGQANSRWQPVFEAIHTDAAHDLKSLEAAAVAVCVSICCMTSRQERCKQQEEQVRSCASNFLMIVGRAGAPPSCKLPQLPRRFLGRPVNPSRCSSLAIPFAEAYQVRSEPGRACQNCVCAPWRNRLERLPALARPAHCGACSCAHRTGQGTGRALS